MFRFHTTYKDGKPYNTIVNSANGSYKAYNYKFPDGSSGSYTDRISHLAENILSLLHNKLPFTLLVIEAIASIMKECKLSLYIAGQVKNNNYRGPNCNIDILGPYFKLLKDLLPIIKILDLSNGLSANIFQKWFVSAYDYSVCLNRIDSLNNAINVSTDKELSSILIDEYEVDFIPLLEDYIKSGLNLNDKFPDGKSIIETYTDSSKF